MTRINIKGPIISNGDKWIYDWLGMDATCPNDITLPEDGSDVTVMINSGGGYVDVGNEIYTILKQYEGNVTVDVIEACSAACTIAMAGNPTRITPAGQIMIHNVSMGAQGDYRVMDKSSEFLKKANESIAMAYELKTGKAINELLAMMDKETWLTAEEAKELGFVDEILFQDEKSNRLVANCENLIPDNIVHALQNNKDQFGNPRDLNLEQITNMIADNVMKKIDSMLCDKTRGLGQPPEPKTKVHRSLLNKLKKEVH